MQALIDHIDVHGELHFLDNHGEYVGSIRKWNDNDAIVVYDPLSYDPKRYLYVSSDEEGNDPHTPSDEEGYCTDTDVDGYWGVFIMYGGPESVSKQSNIDDAMDEIIDAYSKRVDYCKVDARETYRALYTFEPDIHYHCSKNCVAVADKASYIEHWMLMHTVFNLVERNMICNQCYGEKNCIGWCDYGYSLKYIYELWIGVCVAKPLFAQSALFLS